MIILSHRGYWKTAEEQNQPVAFKRSFDSGFGTETDLRWINGQLVIQHDLEASNSISFSQVMEIMNGRNLPLAINIKCDGLSLKIHEAMKSFGHTNYFVFDMSVPDARHQFRAGNPIYTRVSDIEPSPTLATVAEGVWLDAFESDWYSNSDISKIFETVQKICIVSPELHRRPHLKVWEQLRTIDSKFNSRLAICTDLPEEAQSFFKAKS